MDQETLGLVQAVQKALRKNLRIKEQKRTKKQEKIEKNVKNQLSNRVEIKRLLVIKALMHYATQQIDHTEQEIELIQKLQKESTVLINKLLVYKKPRYSFNDIKYAINLVGAHLEQTE